MASQVDSSLQAIYYHRGSLQLLDHVPFLLHIHFISSNCSYCFEQRKLPLDTIYFEIRDAVEVRPTAVNLSDAATKLTEIVTNSAATTTDSNQVFLAYIEAAEVMLEDDVASNKAIGLATAGFGTALGVIRALHTYGVLERAYCIETCPFNQGSRLTAYKLVHGKILVTLIADSTAAALMKTRSIHDVIVGADRVTANGDNAKKIGTYSLALSAKHHGIQFYVAAPLTSVDLSLSSGNEIVIEERPPKELLNTRGGMGEQVTASEICVWNPAFDVTPANLISGIITEKVFVLPQDHDFGEVAEFQQSFLSSICYEFYGYTPYKLKIIQSLLLLQLPGVQEKLKKQIKEVELAQSKEVSLHWYGMAESVQVIGGIYVAFSHLGEIRTLGMLHSRFKWVTSAFYEHLVPMQKEEPKRYHGDYHTRCYE
uniref:S-methyl-5-thioribose-1-phosphate isomerase n=1 Tax=Lactuca sativa TaxID=4236 RepID=A0A9R1XQY5_LACSA|nr:hypothetical protein LSAT_V11C200077270 [Lactuca sativa]